MKFSEFFDIRDGGLAIYGGLIGAIIVGGIIAKVRKLKLTALLDVVAPCFLIGQCIGRGATSSIRRPSVQIQSFLGA